MSAPLVSCIMPTHDRRAFVPLAIDYFVRQDYDRKELVVVDDGSDAVGDLMPDDPSIRYVRLDQRISLGAKRNVACEEATGDLIVHWDDDDWSAPWRLSYQVEGLGDDGEVCGLRELLFYEPRADRGWRYTYPDGNRRPWVAGGTLCYRKDFWQRHRFADLRHGEDTRFLWSSRPRRLVALDDQHFYVALIHRANTSRKNTASRRWSRVPSSEVRAVLGDDAAAYDETPPRVPAPEQAGQEEVARRAERRKAKPVRNVFACLVHEEPMVVWDLVRNLTHLDPSSTVLLYNGSEDRSLLDGVPAVAGSGVLVHPSPRPMEWGKLHGFALDCMEYALEQVELDTLTIVDSDQLALRAGYSDYLGRHLAGEDNVGMLGKAPNRQPRHSREGPVRAALRERHLWAPLLRRLPGGEDVFPYWTFWPSTVFTAAAARDLVTLFATDTELKDIIERSRIWATEEVILPTLVAALGYRVVANPCTYDVVRYRVRYTPRMLDRAMQRPSVYWAHPIPRNYGDPLRRHVRSLHSEYHDGSQPTESAAVPVLSPRSIIAAMERVEGWLDADEADLLLGGAVAALRDFPDRRIVELGSYCGRATVVLAGVVAALRPEGRVAAIDSHDGKVGAVGQGISSTGRTLAKFKRNIAAAGLTDAVEVVVGAPHTVDWREPIGLLLVDGLHDYRSAARDFEHYERHVAEGGYVAFHDYAGYWPGVVALVNEIVAGGRYRRLRQAGSMVLLQKV